MAYGIWHSTDCDTLRLSWFMTKRARIFRSSNPPAIQGNAIIPSKRPPGRPKGAKDKRKRRKN